MPDLEWEVEREVTVNGRSYRVLIDVEADAGPDGYVCYPALVERGGAVVWTHDGEATVAATLAAVESWIAEDARHCR